MAVNNITLCVVICTYRRESYVLANLATLKQNKDVFDHVVIVDNAKSLDLSLADDFAEIIPNKNLGGSGGFTRGLIRAHELGYSHVLLMDDDISFSADAFRDARKTLESLPEAKKDSWIGFAMRPLDNPSYQFEMGAKWNGVKMMINNHGLDMNNPRCQKRNETHHVYNYSAWWSLIMPTSVVDKYGLPLPFFIKFDDIEYGLRRKGEEILFSNDWYILHEDFRKKKTPYLEYYLARNAAVTNAIHFKAAWLWTLLRYHWKCLKALLHGEIMTVHLISLGIKDFLKGPDVLIKEDIEEKNFSLRALANTPIRKIPKAFSYFFESIGLSFRLLFSHHKAKNAWKRSYSYLTSLEFWKGILA